MRTQRLIAYAFIACLVSLLARSAMADDEIENPNAVQTEFTNASLIGKYRNMASGSCATAGALGFTPFPSLQALEAGATGHFGFTGVITYDGAGLATETIRGIGLSDGPYGSGSFPVLTFEETCNWTYTVNLNGSFRRSGTCHGTTTGGQFAGSSYTLSGIRWTGQIGAAGSVLITTSTSAPVVQTLTNGFTLKRICALQGTEVRLP